MSVQFNGQVALQVSSQFPFVCLIDLEALYKKMENPIRNINWFALWAAFGSNSFFSSMQIVDNWWPIHQVWFATGLMHLMLTNCGVVTRVGAIGDEWFHNLSEVKCLDSKFQINFTSSKPKIIRFQLHNGIWQNDLQAPIQCSMIKHAGSQASQEPWHQHCREECWWSLSKQVCI